MKHNRYPTKPALGEAAAAMGARAMSARAIRDAMAARERATITIATGANRFEELDALVRQPDIDWSKVTDFHLDEHVAMPETRPDRNNPRKEPDSCVQTQETRWVQSPA